ncbi:DinB family protein [Hymenobacter fodinae]|uniref:DinB family protein n=1 Tax=Hymenobacter fodinae TaxID=2510796 RepID=A0A4Z0P935_9BACT|nr:DinB family protein [Hymenobacter fodinae]TGE08485.1 DinB family protein [Hymenobacter fodinae]
MPNASLTDLLAHIRTELEQAFAQLDDWFAAPAAARHFRPADGGWTGDEILKHTALTNHFLLILIEKATTKALRNSAGLDLAQELGQYQFKQTLLEEVGISRSFPWVRPEHMEPRGQKSPAEVQTPLREQLQQCLRSLARLPNGEGVLYRTTMSVNGLGKLDVYEYLYFLAKHAKRHVMQLARNAAEYQQVAS